MHSVNLITNKLKGLFLLSITFLLFNNSFAQDNSPLSRFGIGDLSPAQNIVNRGMGGFNIAYSDYGLFGSPFNINFSNPASLGNLTNTKNFSNTIFDLGAEIDSRTLKSTTNTEKYKSNNTTVSYLQVAFPVSSPKMEKRGTSWGVGFGLRPFSKINYKIQEDKRQTGVDSISTVYEGSGGLNQISLSTGIRKIGNGSHKNEFSFGVALGYTFGSKDYATSTYFINDSVYYYKGKSATTTSMGGISINTGLQYQLNANNGNTWRFGAIFNLQENLKAKQTQACGTFGYNSYGEDYFIDTVNSYQDSIGKVTIPSTLGLGLSFHSKNNQWLVGADFERTNWNNSYRFYDKNENVNSNWTIRMGAEYYPVKSNAIKNKYFNYVKYRAGFYFGPDYLKINQVRNNYAFTGGASFPLSTPRSIQSRGEYVTLNSSMEIGARGTPSSSSFHEGIFRLNFGISMNARWFQKRAFD